ncbi:MAG: hypothetical protein JJT94_03175 [Bernardetiaceae bacterium]|nr:hypothetical protein [Bernardetiaceae bacterium]
MIMSFQHKLVYIPVFIGLFLLLLLGSCNRPELPLTRVDIRVSNEIGEFVEGAAIRFYETEADFRADKNAMFAGDTFYTNANGFLPIAFESYIPRVFVSVEKEGRNNWYGNFALILYETEGVNRAAIEIRETMESRLVGRNIKYWKQVRYIINNNEESACQYRYVHGFNYQGFIDLFQSDECPTPGRRMGNDVWVLNEDPNILSTGIVNRRVDWELTRFDEDEMRWRTTYDSGRIVVEHHFEHVGVPDYIPN